VRVEPLEQRLQLQVDLVHHVEVARRVGVAHGLAAEGARRRVRAVHALRVELQKERPRRAGRLVDEVACSLHVQLARPRRVPAEVAARPLRVQIFQHAEGAVGVGILGQEVLCVVKVGEVARRARRDGPRPRLLRVVVRQVRHGLPILPVDVRWALDAVVRLEDVLKAEVHPLQDPTRPVDRALTGRVEGCCAAVLVRQPAAKVHLPDERRGESRVGEEVAESALARLDLLVPEEHPLALGQKAAHRQVARQDGVARRRAQRRGRVHVREAGALRG